MFGRLLKLFRSTPQPADASQTADKSKPFVDPFANDNADPLPETPQAPKAWLAIGLDGALAFDNGQGFGGDIGEPVPNAVQRVRDWVEHRNLEVKVLTPRASTEAGAQAVRDWLSKHNLPPLEVTAQKNLHMVEFWSARCVQVLSNTGQSIGSSPLGLDRPKETAAAQDGDATTKAKD